MLNFFFNTDEKKIEIKNFMTKEISNLFQKKFFSIHFFFILKLSETYAQKILCLALFERGVCESLSRPGPRPNLMQDFIRNVDFFNPKSMVSKSASSLMASGRRFQG